MSCETGRPILLRDKSDNPSDRLFLSGLGIHSPTSELEAQSSRHRELYKHMYCQLKFLQDESKETQRIVVIGPSRAAD